MPPPKTATSKAAADTPELGAILRDLERNASPQYRADMAARYGIVTKAKVYGTPVARLRPMAKRIGVDHGLAEALWQTGIHDARMLATMVGDPALLTSAQMDRWAKDFDNWAIVDTAAFHFFDRSPHAFGRIGKWAKAKDEFVKRAAFALLASCALHGRGGEAEHMAGLALIEREAGDPRNFVKKGVSWALRSIGGKRSPKLRASARELAERLAASDDPTARWVGRDAAKAFAKAARQR